MNDIIDDESRVRIFVIMPFDKKFDDVYEIIKLATKEVDSGTALLPYRLDEIKSAGKITDDLISQINRSPLCIADLTGNNSNVMWEVGYATALRKPIILIAQSHESIPFNLRDYRTINYDRGNLTELRKGLSESIKETLAKYQIEIESRTIKELEVGSFSITVTGTSIADPTVCRRSVESVLRPYLDKNTTFYVGGGGTSDETAAEYLGNKKQKVIVVGHHSLDMSKNMLQIAQKYDFQFVDTINENLPKLTDILKRNLFFAVKSDLTVFLYDGRTSYTKFLIDWWRSHHKDHIVAFVSPIDYH